MTRPKTILYILMGVLLLAVAYAYFQYPRQSRVEGSTPAPKTRVRRPVQAKTEAGEDDRFRLRFDWLQKQQPFSGAKEDLFGPLYGSRQESSMLPPGEKTSPPATERMAPRRSSVPPLEFLGFLASGKTRTYFFAQGDDVFVAKKGTRFGQDAEFRIIAATSEEVKIRKRGEAQILTISLVEKNGGSGFNKIKTDREKVPGAEGNASFPAVSSKTESPPPENPAKEGQEEVAPLIQEFRPEGDWAN